MARRLAGRFEARPLAAINLTPMVPVLLALFAVVAAALSSSRSSLTLDVSPRDPGPVETRPEAASPFISVGKGGELSLDQHSVDPAELEARLKVLRSTGLRGVAIRAEADAAYGDYMSAVRLVRRQGLEVYLINEDIR
ncbi:biopolymer transporter ExbD [Caulobacter sp. Root1472]|uniref:biopolymer transporter ExbD n=1 Tax=Caulobacter sp. Root1472 TaxID=1736470 RepID=UPI0009EC0DE8|nr:biopolymer transporter ExbD [Caulobacter sp. Root1472]